MSRAPTAVFIFETNICATNKTIGAEAMSYLNGKNSFVQVHHDVPNFQLAAWIENLPRVRTLPYGQTT